MHLRMEFAIQPFLSLIFLCSVETLILQQLILSKQENKSEIEANLIVAQFSQMTRMRWDRR